MRVLDVGCGGGSYAIENHLLFGSPTTLCDFSAELLDMARRQVLSAGKGLPADFVECSAEELPLADSTYDFIQCIQVIEHLHQPAKALAEFRRVARPGARLVVSVPHPPEWFPNEGHVVEGYRAAEMIRLVESAGWRVRRVEYCMLILTRLVGLLQETLGVSLPLIPLISLENLVPKSLRRRLLPYVIMTVAETA